MSTALSASRTECLRLLAEGLSPKQVAASLGVSLSSVYRWRDAEADVDLPEGEALRAARPAIVRKLISLAQKGDFRSIKEVLARVEEPVPDPPTHEWQDTFIRVLAHEVQSVSPFLGTTFIDLYLRILQHTNKVLLGELPLPPPVTFPRRLSPGGAEPASPDSQETGSGEKNPQDGQDGARIRKR